MAFTNYYNKLNTSQDLPRVIRSTAEEEAIKGFIDDFQAQKTRREERATSMSEGLVPNRKYSVKEIIQVDTPFGRKQIWTLVDIDDGSWREIWSPESLKITVTDLDEAGLHTLSEKKRTLVKTSLILHYFGFTGPLKKPLSYNFDFCRK